jgi:hypothetical protein
LKRSFSVFASTFEKKRNVLAVALILTVLTAVVGKEMNTNALDKANCRGSTTLVGLTWGAASNVERAFDEAKGIRRGGTNVT